MPDVDLLIPFDLGELETVEPDKDMLIEARLDMGIRVGGRASDMVPASTLI